MLPEMHLTRINASQLCQACGMGTQQPKNDGPVNKLSYQEPRPFGTPRHTWNDNIKMNITAADCIYVVQEDKHHWRAFVDSAVNHRVPQKACNFLVI